VHASSLALYPSRALLKDAKPSAKLSALRRPILELLQALRLVQLEYDKRGAITSTTNLTLINALLVFAGVRGPPSLPADSADGEGKEAAADAAPSGPRITEPTLWGLVMGTQIAGSLLAFTVRYWLAGVVFPVQ
jgi:UDP-N-acetylglucosamine--dolichyl-phosphate N-acetylglucosaminephosphotransferase